MNNRAPSPGGRRLHRAKFNSRPLERDPKPDEVDGGFLDRAYMAPISSSRGPVRLPDPVQLFGPVRILTPEGECVRVIGVDELARRVLNPRLKGDWVGSQETWDNRAKGVQKARVRAQDAPGDEISE